MPLDMPSSGHSAHLSPQPLLAKQGDKDYVGSEGGTCPGTPPPCSVSYTAYAAKFRSVHASAAVLWVARL